MIFDKRQYIVLYQPSEKVELSQRRFHGLIGLVVILNTISPTEWIKMILRVRAQLRFVRIPNMEVNDVVVVRASRQHQVSAKGIVCDRPIDETQRYGRSAFDDGHDALHFIGIRIKRSQGSQQESTAIVHAPRHLLLWWGWWWGWG